MRPDSVDIGTAYLNHLTGRRAIITTETEGPKRCWQRLELQGDGSVEITWVPTYNEACRMAGEWIGQ